MTAIRTYWTAPIKPCTRTAHVPFLFWNSQFQQQVCSVCNWAMGYMGREDSIENYPEAMQEALRRALQEGKQCKI